MLHLAIVGPGRVASHLAADLAHLPDVELSMVAGRRPQPTAAFAEAFGCQRAVTDLAEVADAADIDAVYVATPNPQHLEAARRLLAAGKHVLVEKPLVLSEQDGRALAEAAGTAGCICMEALWTLHLPMVRRALAEIAAGRLGEVRYVHGTFGVAVSRKDSARWGEEGGGALFDLGVYPLSLIQSILGPPESVTGARWPVDGADAWATAHLVHAGGAVAQLAVTIDGWMPSELLVSGTEGHAVFWGPIGAPPAVTFRPGAVIEPGPLVHRAGPRPWQRHPRAVAGRVRSMLPGRTVWSDTKGYGYQYQLAALADAVRQGRPGPAVWPIEDSITMLRTIDLLRAQG